MGPRSTRQICLQVIFFSPLLPCVAPLFLLLIFSYRGGVEEFKGSNERTDERQRVKIWLRDCWKDGGEKRSKLYKWSLARG